ncbi:flagellar filament capping protein FliD [Ureibacillus chungkukjangi]|uniref:flagellar filament capping protein FliD n=1 Tax=Ureibacillus chungkukjangi TaxID=1202712 RepID=UPI002041AF16|nr:flagellar filament capping protein FliD [Ureibacillus chungkukjangi]MCM3389776.1 flagellar filament capping protein FliD [Ureibacillus chungkukjangi]
MVTRVGGLASGMDIDSIVEKLMSAEKAPLNKLYQQQQKYEWERDAYREINTALSTFDDYLFDNFRLSSNFYKKSVTSTNSSLVTATATSAASGTLSIDGVSQLAKSAQGVGSTIVATGSTKISDLTGLASGSKFTLSAINSSGTLSKKELSIDANETVDSLVKKINNSDIGVTALFENGKLSITAKNMGDINNGAEVTVSAGNGATLFNKLGFGNQTGGFDSSTTLDLASGGQNAVFSINGIATERSSNTFSINGYTVTLNSTFNNQSTTAEYTKNMYNNYVIAKSQYNTATSNLQVAEDDVTNKKASLTTNYPNVSSAIDSVEADDQLNAFLMNLGEQGTEKLKKLASLNYNDPATLKSEIESLYSAESTTNLFTQSEVNQLKKLLIAETEATETTEASITLTSSGNTLSVLSEKLNEASMIEGETGKVFTDGAAYFDANKTLATRTTEWTEADKNLDSAKSTLSDALTTNYGITYDFSTDKATHSNGDPIPDLGVFLNNEINNATKVNPVTLTSSTDTDNMVDKIKKFVETYNGLVTTINGKLKETYDRNYPPLTDEQKEDMSEDEIEKWEKKAQTGLLRNDSILTNGLYSMRRTFMDEIGGLGDATINSLAEIGITTSSTTSDGGKLVIDEDKLRTAIEKNADQVASIFTKTGTAKDASKGITEDTRGIAQRLRDELKGFTGEIEKKAGKASSTNQTYTLGKRLDEVKTRIDAWVDKLENIESRYWKQFTAMETAINKANSQSSIFAQA